MKAAECEARRQRHLAQRQWKSLRQVVADVAFVMFARLASGTTLRVARLERRRTEGVERSCMADEVQQRYLRVEVAETIAISEKDKTVGLQKLQGPSCTQ